MLIQTLHLRNFRNYSNETFSFGPHLNIICGDNAQGKTNLIEAICLLSTGRSFRTPHLKDLIKDKEKYFLVEAEIIKDLVSQTIRIYFEEKQKKILYNSSSLSSFTSLLGILPSVMHSPSDVDLISGSPLLRRRFLNLHLAQYDQLYIYHLARFFKALKQRNCLLKNKTIHTIEVWEIEMAKSAAYLTHKRNKMLSLLNTSINQIMNDLSDKKEDLFLKYLPGLIFSNDLNQTYEAYCLQLAKSRKRDLFIGASQFGPHRDDFICSLNNKPAKTFASEGQKRCIVSSLKLAEYYLLCERLQSPAIMNIDDLGMHLDETRQKRLKEHFKSLNQIFVTLPSQENIWEEDQTKILKIENGKIAEKLPIACYQ